MKDFPVSVWKRTKAAAAERDWKMATFVAYVLEKFFASGDKK